MSVESRTFWVLSLFFFLIGLLYWVTADEAAGVVLLMLCSAAAIVCALPLGRRKAASEIPHPDNSASLWPFIIGIGAVLCVNGMVLGVWLFLPGAALVVRGLIGVFSKPPPPEVAPSHHDSAPAPGTASPSAASPGTGPSASGTSTASPGGGDAAPGRAGGVTPPPPR